MSHPFQTMDEIVKEFLVESYDNLDQLDRDLVALEDAPDDRGRLSSIFRTIHTIKGTCGFLGLPRPTGQAESCRDHALVHLCSGGERLLLCVLDDGSASSDAVREGVAHQHTCVDVVLSFSLD